MNLNREFIVLQAIGIILVVVGHVGGISLFEEWFPIYSFHMPLFIFISGYFYKVSNEDNVIKYIIKKIKTLVIPYFIWNFIYGVISTILAQKSIVYYCRELSISTFFISPWLDGHQFGLNVASWFVLALFLVQIVYILLRKLITYFKINNEYIISIFMLSIGVIGIIYANKGYTLYWNLTIVRTMFLLPFFQLGYLYKSKLEMKDKANNPVYFLILFIIQFILIKKYNSLGFSAVFCNDFNRENIMLPFITSITGIMFWLRISKILAKSIGESKMVAYIGKNTWTVMMHHQMVFFVLNIIFIKYYKIKSLVFWDYEIFKSNMWYGYSGGEMRFMLFYVILGIVVPLFIKHLAEKVINRIRVKLNNYNLIFNNEGGNL